MNPPAYLRSSLTESISTAFWQALPTDFDPTETREWLDGFELPVREGGVDRGTCILPRLLDETRAFQVPLIRARAASCSVRPLGARPRRSRVCGTKTAPACCRRPRYRTAVLMTRLAPMCSRPPSRKAVRQIFEVDRFHVTVAAPAAPAALASAGILDSGRVAEAIPQYALDAGPGAPWLL